MSFKADEYQSLPEIVWQTSDIFDKKFELVSFVFLLDMDHSYLTFLFNAWNSNDFFKKPSTHPQERTVIFILYYKIYFRNSLCFL